MPNKPSPVKSSKAGRVARNVVREAPRREHGYIPLRVSHTMNPIKTSTIIQFKLLAVAAVLAADDARNNTDELSLTADKLLIQLGLTGADLKIIKLKAYVNNADFTSPPELYFSNGVNGTGTNFSESMSTSLVKNFDSQLAVACIHPPLDDWLDKAAIFGVRNANPSLGDGGQVRLEVTVQCRIHLPTLQLDPDTTEKNPRRTGFFSWADEESE